MLSYTEGMSHLHVPVCRFCIPFTLATCLGLAALALDLPITVLEANEGLVPPATAFYLLGKGGGILMTVMLLMWVHVVEPGSLPCQVISSWLVRLAPVQT